MMYLLHQCLVFDLPFCYIAEESLEHTKKKLKSCSVRIAELANQESLILFEQEADW